MTPLHQGGEEMAVPEYGLHLLSTHLDLQGAHTLGFANECKDRAVYFDCLGVKGKTVYPQRMWTLMSSQGWNLELPAANTAEV
jgi:hypothetical protein